MTSLFNLSERFQAAIQLINGIDDKRFPLFLDRIAQKLHLREGSPFTDAEEEALQKALQLTLQELHTVIDSCSLLLEQAAYHTLTTPRFAEELKAASLKRSKIEAFGGVWDQHKDNLLEELRNRTVVPSTVQDVDWQLNLAINHSEHTAAERLKQPVALFQLNLRNSDLARNEKIRLEFTHDELSQFFSQLDAIQDQLDALG
ncbi:COMM domain-containing protein 10 [Balamuthia mandrillaris]